MGFPPFHPILLEKHISSSIGKDAMLLLPLVTWNSHHLQAMDYMTCFTLKYFFQHRNAFSLTEGLPPLLQLDFGLWARVSQRFYFILSPRSIFPTSQRFPILKHVTSGSGHVISGSGDVIFGSRDFRFRWRHFLLHQNEATPSTSKRSSVSPTDWHYY